MTTKVLRDGQSTLRRYWVARDDKQAALLCNILDLTPENVARTLRHMPRQRAVGPDEIASEIWIAGGDRLA